MKEIEIGMPVKALCRKQGLMCDSEWVLSGSTAVRS
jgi:hypothetical protein